VVFGMYLLGTLAWCAYMFTRRYRPPTSGQPTV
jgi:hypothetical protein